MHVFVDTERLKLVLLFYVPVLFPTAGVNVVHQDHKSPEVTHRDTETNKEVFTLSCS